MDHRYYRSGNFARKAAVSIRTLRYYDQEGLLTPSQVSESGYRLYTDADLVDLQQILALKFLGFSLDEIKRLRRAGPQSLTTGLAQQRAMMEEKRAQLDAIIQAIEETERLLAAGHYNWDALVRVIQAIQMDQNTEWVKKYFTPEQLEQMGQLSAQAYNAEAREALASRPAWTEADQERASAQWATVAEELKRLVAAGADPAGPEAQALARQYTALIAGFTGGHAAVQQGLSQWWQNYTALPADQRPFQMPHSAEEGTFLQQATALYRRQAG